MLSNILKDRIIIQKKTITLGDTGETVTWETVETRWGRVIPLDAKSRLAYQQVNSVVTDRIQFRRDVSINLSEYRFVKGSQYYEPVNPPRKLDNGYSIDCVETN